MDIHNLEEYLDLQDQNKMNLLSTEEVTQPEQEETEWHAAAGPLDTMLDPANPYLFNENNNNNNDNTDWGLLQNGLVDLQGINLTQIIGNGGILVSNQDNFITPDSLFKQPPLVMEEKRVTRSRTNSKVTPPIPKKKKKTTKKLYCICQQPYNGKPMVQCDTCEDWFHCSCVDFDPDDGEDIDWVCPKCIEVKKEIPEKEATPPPQSQPKVTITIPAPTRQTRGSNRTQSKCLYEGCNNRTRADSYCSDVCARKKNEQLNGEEKTPRSTRLSRMRTASMSESPKSRRTSTTKKNSPVKVDTKEQDDDDEYEHVKDEEEEEEKPQEIVSREGTETPDTPMSPSQMTEQENPVRRNVIKNMASILKTIMETSLKENPDLFGTEELTVQERAENLAKSIENTMLEQLGDLNKSQHHRTCGEPYKSKFRSLLYNLKDKQNKVFQVRVITGDLNPLELVKMSSEDMANPELKSMSEVLRKAALKNSVMKLDNTPIIKKTHKGDIIMVPNKDNDTNQNMYSEQVEHSSSTITTKIEKEQQQSKTITSFSPTTNSNGSKLDPLDDILARISIPAHNSNNDDSNNKRNSSSSSSSDIFTIADQTKKRKVILDVAELLGEEEETPFQVEEVDTSELLSQQQQQQEEKEDVEMKEVEEEKKELPCIWQGRVNMPQVAEFEASARQIGGRLLTEEEWTEVLSPTMWIEGRIPADRVTSYVTQSQYSNSREIVLLEIEPDKNTTNTTQSQTLLKYLDTRQRYAVVGHNKIKVKDFYLIPLYKVQDIPDCLYVVRVEETKRECDLFLGVLVLSKQQPMTNIKSVTTPVTKQVYSTPMAQPMYLLPTYSQQQQQQQQQQQELPQQPQPQQQLPQQPQYRQPRQEYNNNYGYQKPSYGRNNNNNQRNHYSSYNQRNSSSHYRPSY